METLPCASAGDVRVARVYEAIERDEEYRNKKIRDAAEGEQCTLLVPGICRDETLTTVWCHSPYQEHGKAGKRKAHDCFGCIGCHRCHTWLDGAHHQMDVLDAYHTFIRAMCRSWLVLLRKGVLK